VTERKFQPDNPLHCNTTYSRSTVNTTGTKKPRHFWIHG
jgi:hypothetical protein